METTGDIELAGAFWRHAHRAPDSPALWVEGRTTSYGELAARRRVSAEPSGVGSLAPVRASACWDTAVRTSRPSTS
ncbi:MAG: D-alanine--poly(phosphoribitol) ligase [bacterium]|nr:D-alanine--poly(phosphoribitol) ligase [bacterium]